MRRASSIVGAVVLVAVAWGVARSWLAGVPEAEERPADPQASAIVSHEAPVARGCLGGGWFEDAETHPVLMLETIASGWVDVCMDVFRISDLDPTADYYIAAASAYWTTESGWSGTPLTQPDTPPLGPATIAIEVSEPHLDNVFLADHVVLDACQGSAEPASITVGGAVFAPCAHRRGVTEAENGDRASWTIEKPSALDHSVHTLEVKVGEGSAPTFTLLAGGAEAESSVMMPTGGE